MKKNFINAIVLTIALGSCLKSVAQEPKLHELTSESPSRRYKVEATSPEKIEGRRYKTFQEPVTYTCWDETAKKMLWTRKQNMTPDARGWQKEFPPGIIFVSDKGWTVVVTEGDRLFALDQHGHDLCHIHLLSEALTPDENVKYVRHVTDRGPMWAECSLRYFLDVGDQSLFIIRPWWGRRIILNMETGKLIPPTDEISTGALAYERNYVTTTLANGVKNPPNWEVDLNSIWPIFDASYLAGRIPVEEAIPFLEKLQDSPFIGCYAPGPGEVTFNSWSIFTLREIIHLSLRRLGKKPSQLPVYTFYVQLDVPYVPKPLSVARENNTDKIKKGMSAEEVLDLIGAPDFVDDTWDYDMDGISPFTLTIKWDKLHVTDVRKQAPALWKDSFVRDEQIVYGN